jgi:hypothetical protein
MKTAFELRIFICGLILLTASLACNLPQSTPTADLAGVVAQTRTAVAVNQFLTSTSVPVLASPSSTQQIPPATESAAPVETQIQPTTAASAQPPASPALTTAQQNCSNLAKFEGETVPDNTVFGPGQDFMKTWILRNNGTCTWSADYQLVYVKGKQMAGTSPVPIGQSVPPGSSIQIYLPQKAPQEIGEHQGFWMLSNPAGKQFGLGKNADVAFWVKISVVPGASNGGSGGPFPGLQNLGAPSWIETFAGNRSPWYLGTDEDTDYDIQDGRLIISTLEQTGDVWRVAQPGYLDDFYLQAKFRTGTACSGKDGYGLIVRAPEKANGVINSGYVFTFSCDGKYRVYRMDSGNFNGIQNWANNPAVKAGPNQSNDLGIYAKEDTLQFYANGIMIYELLDDAYLGGLYGLVIRSEISKNFQVAVDEVAAWNIQ